MTEKDYKLSKEDYNAVLADIWERSFSHVVPAEHPRAYIVGGQPGAGKTTIIDTCIKNFPDKNVVTINGDEYRGFHPQSLEIFINHDKDYAKLTDPDVRAWTKETLEAAIDNKYNLIFEGTLRTTEIADTITHMKEQGYEVCLNVISTNELDSKAMVLKRYEDQLEQCGTARYTSLSAHNAAYENMVDTLRCIEERKECKQIQVVDRSGKCIYDSNNDNEISAAESLVTARNATWDIERYQTYILQNEQLIERMAARGEEPQYIEAVCGLSNQAESMLNQNDKRVIEKVKEIQSALPINKLPRNPHAKDVYNSYAKEAMTHTGNIWKYERTDHLIVEKMAIDGISTQRMGDAVGFSPAMLEFKGMEKISKAHAFADQMLKQPELQKLIDSKGKMTEIAR